jgi:GntR family transcriptional repressor for pyruvate dehydrogenase complex
MTGTRSVQSPQYRRRKLYDKVADSIASSIRDGKFANEGRLPSERDLAEKFKVSRPTVREAMIALEIRGLVESRRGSGVYVTARAANIIQSEGEPSPELNIGPFELTEARRLFEGEAAALAATLMTPERLAILESLVERMERFDAKSETRNLEWIDRQFHLAIAETTQNSAIVAVVENLWDWRYDSFLCRSMLARATVTPVASEHRTILNALKTRDPQKAREAMRSHLTQVIDAIFKATELDVVEKAKSEIKAQRSEYAKRALI